MARFEEAENRMPDIRRNHIHVVHRGVPEARHGSRLGARPPIGRCSEDREQDIRVFEGRADARCRPEDLRAAAAFAAS